MSDPTVLQYFLFYSKIVKLYVVASKVPVIRWYYLQEWLRDVNCKIVSKEMYIDIFRRLRDAVRRKRLVNWRTYTTMLQRNCISELQLSFITRHLKFLLGEALS
jgi:hypothetical protein